MLKAGKGLITMVKVLNAWQPMMRLQQQCEQGHADCRRDNFSLRLVHPNDQSWHSNKHELSKHLQGAFSLVRSWVEYGTQQGSHVGDAADNCLHGLNGLVAVHQSL